jgi:hypothetical protein
VRTIDPQKWIQFTVDQITELQLPPDKRLARKVFPNDTEKQNQCLNLLELQIPKPNCKKKIIHITDCRFEDEYNAFKQMGAFIVQVQRMTNNLQPRRRKVSALRRLWTLTESELRHSGYTVRVHRWGEQWMWMLLEDAASPSVLKLVEQGESDTYSAAQSAAEQAIERALGAMTREAIILESANVDCREVRS